MNSNEYEIATLINIIGNLDDNTERIYYYEKNKSKLVDYDMFFVDTIFGKDKAQYLNQIADLDYDVNSLFYSNKLLCINKNILDRKNKGLSTTVASQVCISFDLNIVSQLKDYDKLATKDQILKKVIDICKSGECAFDIMPFILENLMKKKGRFELDSYALEDIRAFETMFPFKRSKYDRYSISVEERMNKLLKFYGDAKFKNSMLSLYNSIYLIELLYLLAIIHIYFKYNKRSPEHKFEKFLEFCDNKLKAFHPCANNLAKLFYNNANLRFFRKVQKSNKSILDTAENMAWDLFHLRFLEKVQEFSFVSRDVILVPIFISKDKGLNEIRKAYQIKCMFQNKRTGKCTPSYVMNSIDQNKIILKYFTEEKIKGRLRSEHNVQAAIDELKSLIIKDINN